ncbi:MAG: hypothetical protein GY725_25375 [bacterium]|nr:hypothetical protein [bacterium]
MSKSDDDPTDAATFDWRAFTPEDSPKGLPDIMADPDQKRLATADLVEGDIAFDFESPVADFSTGSERSTGEIFHLQALAAARPVALIFGSYT